MDTIELCFYLPDDWHELLIAELSDLDFDAFLQEDGALKAYTPAARWDGPKREAVALWLHARGLDAGFEENVVEATNWNRQWEETIQPMPVGRFLIRPTWALTPPEYADRLLLEIDPKMSFGTGYHPSTRLALGFLERLVAPGMRVLDAGAGTGILGIAALKLGAASAVGFDIDPWAQENAVENMYLNHVEDRFEMRAGALETVEEEGFDLILANINRNVLLAYLPAFARKLAAGGAVVLAGLLTSDRAQMLEAARRAGLGLADEADEGDWWSCVLRPAAHA